ncbi:MAG: Rab family GTPase [Promethearchaeota archaeon]
MSKKPIILKILTAGEGGVGKTTLLYRYVEERFVSDTRMTIGVEFFLKEVEIDGTEFLLQIWDFGGQDRFRFFLESYARGSNGAVLLFDLTNPLSLSRLEDWVAICRSEDPDLPILFVGSKLDLVEDDGISNDLISYNVEKYKMFDFIEISSKTGQNVEKAFRILTEKIVHDMKEKEL